VQISFFGIGAIWVVSMLVIMIALFSSDEIKLKSQYTSQSITVDEDLP